MEKEDENILFNPNFTPEKEIEERKDLKSRLIDLKVDLVKIHAMPIYIQMDYSMYGGTLTMNYCSMVKLIA